MEKQNKHLQSVENLCQSCLDFHDKAVIELKKKVSASRSLYVSNVEGIQNAVRLHKSNSIAGLEDISSIAAANCSSLHHLWGKERQILSLRICKIHYLHIEERLHTSLKSLERGSTLV